MSANSIFSFLEPKENKFFPLLNHVADNLVQASNLLVEFVSTPDHNKMERIYSDIHSLEHDSDDVTDNIFAELYNSFVTPFDREDIHSLCDAIDDTMDGINSSSKRIILYQFDTIPWKIVELCKLIQEDAQAISVAVSELKTIKKKSSIALAQYYKLHDIEHRGDEIYENFVKGLFESETNSIEVIKSKDIIQELEGTTDCAKNVGQIIRTIIVKYA